jgi:hypothetical protein
MKSTYAQKSSTLQKAAAPNAASVLDSSPQSESLQRKADMANNATQRAEAPRPNNTGMPDNLKAGIESLSGFSMDDVRVHYNSSKPATVQALAYTQGTDIHVAPGQEKHLPHEAWHVAQQMAGRVSPTTNINGMPVNDNAALEHEADVMGEKAVVQYKTEISCEAKYVAPQNTSIQRYIKNNDYILSKEKDGKRNIAVKENEASTIYIRTEAESPDELNGLGIEKTADTEDICNDKYSVYKQKKMANQTTLCTEDEAITKGLLTHQKEFIQSLINLLDPDLISKDSLLSMIYRMRIGIPLQCLGNDINNAVFAMYNIALKNPISNDDRKVLDIIKNDLSLRLSQIENEMDMASYNPIICTECSGSARQRNQILNKDYGSCSYVQANFEAAEYLSWEHHAATYIQQNLSDDSLYIEDAVGKSLTGKEKANAHWFAHIYGVEESSNLNPLTDDFIPPYSLNTKFEMNNLFNKIENSKLKNKFKGEWSVKFAKKQLNLELKVKYDETQNKFFGFFEQLGFATLYDNREKNEKYLIGVMDFMVQTANCAIDGMLVENEAKEGFEQYKKNDSKSPYLGETSGPVVGNYSPSMFIYQDLLEKDSLLSIVKASKNTKKQSV